MNTGNTLYLDPKENQKYYSKSDGNFMPLDRAAYAHNYLDRIRWARTWVHNLGSESHLSIGCKDGYICHTLTAEGVDCIGLDPSTDAIEEARLKASELDLDITFIEGFAEDLPEDIKVDTIDCLEVIEHVVDPDKLLRKLCKIGMYIMISTPDANGRHGLEDAKRNPEHIRLFTKDELEKLVSKYGIIKESIIQDDQLLIIFRPK